MSIIRRQRTTWTSVDNRILNDAGLSLKAMGLLVYMLSKPDNWEFNQEQLGRQFDEGRLAMRSVMRTLMECGYVRREIFNGPDGKIRTLTIVSELPDLDHRRSVTCQAAEPPVGDPPGGQPTPLVTTDVLVTTEVVTTEVHPAERDPFDVVWGAYPPRPGRSKQLALKAWRARINAGVAPARMIAGVVAYAAYCKALGTEGHFIKQPETFLGPACHFDSDWTIPAGKGTKPGSSKSIAGMDYSEGFDAHGNIL